MTARLPDTLWRHSRTLAQATDWWDDSACEWVDFAATISIAGAESLSAAASGAIALCAKQVPGT